MITWNTDLLVEAGYEKLTAQQADLLLKELLQTMEGIIGMKFATEMSDQQLDLFEQFIDANDEAGALKWLERNFPGYQQVVEETLNELLAELRVVAREAQGDTELRAQED